METAGVFGYVLFIIFEQLFLYVQDTDEIFIIDC